MHSEYTATETAATCVANPADPGSAVRKQATEATGRTPFSSVHPKQAMRLGDHRQYDLSYLLVLARVLPPPCSGAALASFLAPPSAFPLTSREQTHDDPPSSQASHPA
jgi:hypothetical protein